jgi:hypothetical protein
MIECADCGGAALVEDPQALVLVYHCRCGWQYAVSREVEQEGIDRVRRLFLEKLRQTYPDHPWLRGRAFD